MRLSKNFISDTSIGAYQVVPLVYIASKNEYGNYTVHSAFSTDRINIEVAATGGYDESDRDRISTLSPIVKSISNVKSGIDHDSKKIKANRMRITLYNHSTVKDKFFDLANASGWTNWNGLNLVLFYKSQSTDLVEFPDDGVEEFRDNSCPLVFLGKITRVDSTEDLIKIQAEDTTLTEILGTKMPYYKLGYLKQDDGLNINKHSEDDTLPMVYGDVDKAPCVALKANTNNDVETKIIHDRHGINDNFTTNPIPNNLKSRKYWHYGDGPILASYIYMIDDDDYVMLDIYPTVSRNTSQNYVTTNRATARAFNYSNNQRYAYTSYKHLWQEISSSKTYIVPELREDKQNQLSNSYSANFIKYAFPVSCHHSGDNSADVSLWTTLDNMTTTNINSSIDSDPVCDLGGYKKEWYRHDSGYTHKLKNQVDGEIPQHLISTQEFNNNSDPDYLHKASTGKMNYISIIQLDNRVKIAGAFMSLQMFKANWQSSNPTPSSYSHGPCVAVIPLDLKLLKIINDNVPGAGWNGLEDPLPAEFGGNLEDYTGAMSNVANEFDSFASSYILSHSALLQLNNPSNYANSINNFWKVGTLGAAVADPFNNYAGWETFMWLDPYGLQSSSYQAKGFNHGIFSLTDPAIYSGNIPDNQEIFPDNTYPNGSTNYETDRIAVMLMPSGINVDDSTDKTGPYYCGYALQQSAFEGIIEKDMYEDKLFASIQGRMIPLYALPNIFFAPDFTPSNFWSYNIGNSSTSGSYQYLFKGANGSKPSSSGYLTIHNHILDQVAEHSLDWSYYHDWKSIYVTNLDFPPDNYYSLEPYIERILKPLDTFSYKPDPSIDDGIVYLCPFVVNKILIPMWKKYLYYYFRVLVNRDLYETGGYADNTHSAWIASLDLQEQYEKGSIGGHSLFYHMFGWFFQKTYSWFYDTTNVATGIGADTWFFGQFTDASSSDFPSENPYNWSDLHGLGEDYINDTLYQTLKAFTSHYYSHESDIGSKILIEEKVSPESHEIEFTLEAAYRAAKLGVPENQLTIDSPVVDKPIDIVLHLLAYEIGFGILGDFNPDDLSDYPMLDAKKFDLDSIVEARDIHGTWKMGFALDQQVDSVKLLEEFLSNTKSNIKFTNDGKLGFVTIKDSYNNDDIDVIIDSKDVINYKFSKTKIEEVKSKSTVSYRYDNGMDKYISRTATRDVKEFLPNYYSSFYKMTTSQEHKDVNLRFISDNQTAIDFQIYDLLNKCNQHNLITMELPLSYMMEAGTLIHIPLINNTKAFGMDYSKVNFINGQYVYPLWLVTSADVGLDTIKISAYQLHHLDKDLQVDFVDLVDGSSTEVYGITQEYSDESFIDGSPIPIWNYNPYATTNILPDGTNANDGAISYLSFDASSPDVGDVVMLSNAIQNGTELTTAQQERFKYSSSGELYPPESNINVLNLIDLVNIITTW